MARGRTPTKRTDSTDSRISVYTRIPVDLHDRAVAFYEAEDRSIAWLIKEALGAYLTAYEAGKAPKPTTVRPPVASPPVHQAQPFLAPKQGNARYQPGV